MKILYILDNKFFIHITGKCSLPFCDLPFNQGHHSFDVQELFDFMKFHLAIIGLHCLANGILKEARRKWTLTCRVISSLMWVWEPKPVFSTAEQSLKMQIYFYIYYFDLVYWKIALGLLPLRGVNNFVLKRHRKRKLLMLLETPTSKCTFVLANCCYWLFLFHPGVIQSQVLLHLKVDLGLLFFSSLQRVAKWVCRQSQALKTTKPILSLCHLK